MALREVLRNEPPARRAGEVRLAHVEREGERPQGDLRTGVEQRADDEEHAAGRGPRRQAEHRAAQPSVLAAREQEQGDVRGAHGGVRQRELEAVARERVRHRQRHQQHRRHRRDQGDPDRALLGVHDAREPRIAGPRPPQEGEHQHGLGEPAPRRPRHDQRGALRDREDEHEVEEELERPHALALPHRRAEARPVRGLVHCAGGYLAPNGRHTGGSHIPSNLFAVCQ